MTNMKSGFYTVSKGRLVYAPNGVTSISIHLLASEHANYTYPVEGYYWFDTPEEACSFFNLDIKDYLPTTSTTTTHYGLRS